ncbi:unnamed protein product (macronuclear) [Paramecium tetraurelia]|uniref:Uncharacterized protein n=1 Tax=Paramecium tetraurelia TaxID=5888 RepID=A0C5G4_PARTE|nr:uncharacterized protein GSPATT00006530001 [Paramecium tetraurelia]CAK66031.1 unnamed protein product [Paramecium tetraurelia]|eukprot:XP_001433428.1 hypothetical protein (macronuclear) [Paramecium tetraurelia strain d4-2]
MLGQLHSKYEIDDLFRKIIEDKYELMQRTKADNPNLLLPKDFSKFITERLFMDFLLTIYDYCVELHKLEKKQSILDQQSKERTGIAPKLLSSETDKINQKLKEISEIYSRILLKKGSYNIIIKDQKFFETLIYFITQVLKEVFDKSEYKYIEEEINRIFRTNPFNLLKRKHINEKIEQRHYGARDYKGVKHDFNPDDDLSKNELIQRILTRKGMPKSIDREMMVEKSNLKPFFIKSTRCAAIKARSPLIAIMFPSAKERLFQMENERKQLATKYTQKQRLVKDQVEMWIQDFENRQARVKSEHEHTLDKSKINKKGSQSFYQ